LNRRPHETDRFIDESPTAGYAQTLTVSPLGAVVDYPGVFEGMASG